MESKKSITHLLWRSLTQDQLLYKLYDTKIQDTNIYVQTILVV